MTKVANYGSTKTPIFKRRVVVNDILVRQLRREMKMVISNQEISEKHVAATEGPHFRFRLPEMGFFQMG